MTAVAGLPACSFCRNIQNFIHSTQPALHNSITRMTYGIAMDIRWKSKPPLHSERYAGGVKRKIQRWCILWLIFGYCVLPPLQITSRRSAQRVMDIPTHVLMCRFCTWEKMMCRAQECLGRSRATLSLRFHPPTPHSCCLLDPATHRHPKYPSTQNILRHRKHPNTLWCHIILSIHLSQPEKGLNRKVRMKCCDHISAMLTSWLVNAYSDGKNMKSCHSSMFCT